MRIVLIALAALGGSLLYDQFVKKKSDEKSKASKSEGKEIVKEEIAEPKKVKKVKKVKKEVPDAKINEEITEK